MGYIGLCGPRVWFFSRSGYKSVGYRFWPFCSEIGYGFCTLVLKRQSPSTKSTTINKSPMFRVTLPTTTVIYRVSNFWSGHKSQTLVIRVLGSGRHTPPNFFMGVTPGVIFRSRGSFLQNFPPLAFSHSYLVL